MTQGKAGGWRGVKLTRQDKIFRMVHDPSGVTPRGLPELLPVGKYLLRKLNRVLDLLALSSPALLCPYLAPGVVCHAVSELMEEIPPHDHTTLDEVELNQRHDESVPRSGPYRAWANLRGLEGRHGEVLGFELIEG